MKFKSSLIAFPALILLCIFISWIPASPSQTHHIPSTTSGNQKPLGGDKKLEAARWNNLGVAHMEQQDFSAAISDFSHASQADKSLAIPRLNLALAFLNQNEAPKAKSLLLSLASVEPRNPRVWYNLGLLYRNSGDLDSAVKSFKKVADLAPENPDAHYFLGDLFLQSGQIADSLTAFRAALQIKPLYASAEFGMARAYQRQKDFVEAKKHLERFQEITRKKLDAPISQVYGEQGAFSFVQPLSLLSHVPSAIHITFLPATENSGLPVFGRTLARNKPSQLGSGVCVFDFDGDGRPDIFLPNNGGKGPALFKNLGGGHFKDVTSQVGPFSPQNGIGCAVADYDNDGLPDVAVGFPGKIVLYHNDRGKFHEVTDAAGIHFADTPIGITFVDYDHDGDLDLYVTGIHGNVLLRNNGNGTFTDVTSSTGLTGGSSSSEAIASDVNNDRAVDLVVTDRERAPHLYTNPREGSFPESQPWNLPSAIGASILDFNKDGWMDVAFTLPAAPGISLQRNVDGKRFEPVQLPVKDWVKGWGVAAFDYDNDGWIDLAAIGETKHGSEIRLFRNRGPLGFQDVTDEVGLNKIKLHDPRALVAFDFEGHHAAGLLITQLDGSVVLLRNIGANQNHAARITFKGLADNKAGIGARVEVFAGDQYQKWEVAGSSGYLSQAPPNILVGLGKKTKADVIRMLWPTGVLQDETRLTAESTENIGEIDRRGSSCPVLFAWDGQRFKMITDIIGPAVIGHWTGPNERDIPDPDEYVKVDGSDARPRNGLLSFRFAEPMEEVNYLDQVRLLAVDHRDDVSVFPNERFVSNPPFPHFRIITSTNAHPPVGAWDGKGEDVLPLLLKAHHKYVNNFKPLKFAGFAESHVLELDLGTWDRSKPLRLLMHGFVNYFSANSMYAAYQSGIKVVAPYVEALNAKGQWVRVIDDMGFPAGLPRTMVADLTGHLPPGTRRIRITTNLQIYWDQILIDNSVPEKVRSEEVPLTNASLHFHGYPRYTETNAPGDLDYQYENMSLTGPYARHEGNYTRYGDVKPLLTKVDDKFVVFGSGEEVKLDFDPKDLPPLPKGWTRDYFFYANGFVKDMDFYESHPLTVSPMPFHAMKDYPYPDRQHFPQGPASLQYQLEYNNRYQSGETKRSYSYHYSK